MGAEVKSLRNIFFYQGIFITPLGAGFGVALGTAVVLIQKYYSVVIITGSMAYPVNFNAMNIFNCTTNNIYTWHTASRIAAGRVGKKLLETS